MCVCVIHNLTQTNKHSSGWWVCKIRRDVERKREKKRERHTNSWTANRKTSRKFHGSSSVINGPDYFRSHSAFRANLHFWIHSHFSFEHEIWFPDEMCWTVTNLQTNGTLVVMQLESSKFFHSQFLHVLFALYLSNISTNMHFVCMCCGRLKFFLLPPKILWWNAEAWLDMMVLLFPNTFTSFR